METSYLILEGMYQEAEGQPNVPVRVRPTLDALGPGLAGPELEGQLSHLQTRGLIAFEGTQLALITPRGLRALYVRFAADGRLPGDDKTPDAYVSQDIQIEDPVESEDEDELNLDAIMNLVREARTRPDSGAGLPRPNADASATPARDRITRIRSELTALTRDLAVTASLDADRWEQALEIEAQLNKLASALERLLKPRT